MLTVRTAADFMRHEIVTLDPAATVSSGVEILLKNQITGIPVVDAQRRYLGMFSEKCAMHALAPAAEQAGASGAPIAAAPGFMAKKLLILRPETDAFDAIDQLLAMKISGAPVVDEDGRCLGSFSEKTAMRVLVTSAYESVPSATVGFYMNPDQDRVIGEDTTCLEASAKFRTTPYRRLPVLRGSVLLGQVSRRDVVRVHEILTRHAGGARNEPVEAHMDTVARTIEPGDDLLTVAQIFETTPYRRLPVLKDGKLVGQVSRRDLLRAAAELLRPEPERPRAEMLYLSPLLDSAPPEVRG